MTDPTNFKAHSGFGVEATIKDQVFRLGKPGWFEQGPGMPDDLQEMILALQNKGRTVMVLAKGRDVLGLLSVSDVVKPESKQAIQRLHDEGLKVVMLTGDNLQTARAIASEVNVDEVEAEIKPGEKSGKIKGFQQKHVLVGMVGDGINDAPALAQADIGFAIGTGTDIAIETGDVILSSGRLTGIPKAITISGKPLPPYDRTCFWHLCTILS